MPVNFSDIILAKLAAAVEEQIILWRPEGEIFVTQASADLFRRPLNEMKHLAPQELLEPTPPVVAPDETAPILSRVITPMGVGPMVKGVVFGLENQEQLWLLKGDASLVDLGSLTAGLIHNLAGPLSVIRSTAELSGQLLQKSMEASPAVRREVDSWPASARQWSAIVIAHVDALASATRDLLAKARGEAALHSGPLRINEILRREAMALVEGMGLKRSVELCFELDDALPLIHGLYADFSQSLGNLIRNALQAMANSDEKVLIISSAVKDGHIQVTIMDTGGGIPEEGKDRIFDPFFSRREGRSKGMGLGLHSVRQLMLPYKVSIGVESRPGKTVFTLNIPIAKGLDDV